MGNKTLKQILFDLLRIDSSKKEGECARYIINFLKNKGFEIEVKEVEEGRQNVIAKKGKPKIVLAAHTDTVGYTKSEWKKLGLDPLKPVEKNGKIYGRGAADMKAGIAIMLKIAEEHGKKGLMLLFDIDEETDFKGITAFIEEYKNKKGFKPELFVFLEPTNLKIANKHKGLYECRYQIRGKSEHSSRPQLGNNPAKLLIDLFKLEEEMKNPRFHDKESNLSPTINFGNGQFGLETDFDKSKLACLDKETKEELNWRITLYKRNKLNSVPNIFEFCFDIRTTKQFEDNKGIDFVTKFIENSVKKRGLKIIKKQIVNNKPSLFIEKNRLTKIEKAVKTVLEKCEYDVFKAGYTEAGIIKALLGIDAINLGPTPVNMAHCTGEYVTTESLQKMYKIAERIVNLYL